MIPVFEYTLTVSPEEIDSQQHVHNLRYLQWTLWAAHAHSAAGGWDSAAALARGEGWVVRSHDITYRAAAFAGDEVTIQTWIDSVSDMTTTRRYQILRPKDQTVLAKVATRWAFVDLTKRRAIPIPNALLMQIAVVAKVPLLPWKTTPANG